jgi:hypothetical protein
MTGEKNIALPAAQQTQLCQVGCSSRETSRIFQVISNSSDKWERFAAFVCTAISIILHAEVLKSNYHSLLETQESGGMLLMGI